MTTKSVLHVWKNILGDKVKKFNAIGGTLENPDFNHAVRMINEETDEFLSELVDMFVVMSYYDEIAKEILDVDLVKTVWFPIAVSLSPTLQSKLYDKGYDIVTRNLSKFSNYDPDKLEDYQRHCTKLESDGRYKGVTFEVRQHEDESYVVWRDEKGKILKGIDFQG